MENKQFIIELPLPVARELEDIAMFEGITVEDLVRNIVVADVLELPEPAAQRAPRNTED
jgi:hypothetical protein